MPIKKVDFRGSSLADLRLFSEAAKRDAGYQLDRIQRGLEPTDFKFMRVVGKSVYEIRIEESTGAFRVIYIAKFKNSLYVLHCFQKKTQKTAKRDLELAKSRYAELMRERRDEN
jgi:phage-related protein